MDIVTWLQQLNPNTLIPSIGSVGFVTFIVISIVKGWLVPKSIYTDRMADKDRIISNLTVERDTWRDAHSQSEESRAILSQQNSDLIESGKTTNYLIESLRNLIERGERDA